jgi:hypothetical protein
MASAAVMLLLLLLLLMHICGCVVAAVADNSERGSATTASSKPRMASPASIDLKRVKRLRLGKRFCFSVAVTLPAVSRLPRGVRRSSWRQIKAKDMLLFPSHVHNTIKCLLSNKASGNGETILISCMQFPWLSLQWTLLGFRGELGGGT